MVRDILKEWNENRKWLEDNGFSTELKELSSQIHALARLACDPDRPLTDSIIIDGVSEMFINISNRLTDLAAGKLSYDLLPKE